MKTKTLLLLAAILVLVIAAACNDDPAANGGETPCTLGAHLGIGETCSGTNCTLQNYNTSTGSDAFPVPIYRIGAESSFASAAATPAAMADHILSIYSSLESSEKNAIKNGVQDVKLIEVHIFNSGMYTWDKSILGLPSEISPFGGILTMIANGNLPLR